MLFEINKNDEEFKIVTRFAHEYNIFICFFFVIAPSSYLHSTLALNINASNLAMTVAMKREECRRFPWTCANLLRPLDKNNSFSLFHFILFFSSLCCYNYYYASDNSSKFFNDFSRVSHFIKSIFFRLFSWYFLYYFPSELVFFFLLELLWMKMFLPCFDTMNGAPNKKKKEKRIHTSN